MGKNSFIILFIQQIFIENLEIRQGPFLYDTSISGGSGGDRHETNKINTDSGNYDKEKNKRVNTWETELWLYWLKV